MSSEQTEPTAQIHALVTRLREQSQGVRRWYVQHKVDKGVCIWFDEWQKHEAEEWWRDHPSHHDDYELVLLQPISAHDRLLRDAANTIENTVSVIRELLSAMHDYEMDVDADQPHKHRQMIARAYDLLGG